MPCLGRDEGGAGAEQYSEFGQCSQIYHFFHFEAQRIHPAVIKINCLQEAVFMIFHVMTNRVEIKTDLFHQSDI